MDRDKRLYFALICPAAVAFATGGAALLCTAFREGRRDAEIARHERGESLAKGVHMALKNAEGQTARARAMADWMADMQTNGEVRVTGAFLWRRGAGVEWSTNVAPRVAAALPPDMRWPANRKKGFSSPRGWFSLAPDALETSVAWARLEKNEVAGLVADMRDDLKSGSPAVLFAAGTCLVALLFCALAAGSWALVRSARRAREESERKTTFIDNLSHELKLPLAVVRMKTERLLSGRVKDPESLQAAYRVIADENGAVIRQIDDLLELVRTGKGTRRYEYATFDLAEAVREVAAAMADRFEPHGILVSADAPAMANADIGAARQIVRNLLDNAAKYAAAKGPVEVKVARAEGRASVVVSDRGDGIPPGEMEAVFERFYRLDNDLTRTTGGTGIGLSLARCLARDMGGDLHVAARPGGGCVFTLELQEVPHG